MKGDKPYEPNYVGAGNIVCMEEQGDMKTRAPHHEKVIRLIRTWRGSARYWREKADWRNSEYSALQRLDFIRMAISYERMAGQLYREVISK